MAQLLLLMVHERKKDSFHSLNYFVGSFQLNISPADSEAYMALKEDKDKVVSPAACVHSQGRLLLCHLQTISFLFGVLIIQQIPVKVKILLFILLQRRSCYKGKHNLKVGDEAYQVA